MNAGPNVDFDHTGQTNLFKYIAGLDPLDSNSRFTLSIGLVPDPLHPGQFLSGQKNLTFNPVVGGRTYTITAKRTFSAPAWSVIAASAPSDSGATRTITDLNATVAQKFYHVEIAKP